MEECHPSSSPSSSSSPPPPRDTIAALSSVIAAPSDAYSVVGARQRGVAASDSAVLRLFDEICANIDPINALIRSGTAAELRTAARVVEMWRTRFVAEYQLLTTRFKALRPDGTPTEIVPVAHVFFMIAQMDVALYGGTAGAPDTLDWRFRAATHTRAVAFDKPYTDYTLADTIVALEGASRVIHNIPWHEPLMWYVRGALLRLEEIATTLQPRTVLNIKQYRSPSPATADTPPLYMATRKLLVYASRLCMFFYRCDMRRSGLEANRVPLAAVWGVGWATTLPDADALVESTYAAAQYAHNIGEAMRLMREGSEARQRIDRREVDAQNMFGGVGTGRVGIGDAATLMHGGVDVGEEEGGGEEEEEEMSPEHLLRILNDILPPVEARARDRLIAARISPAAIMHGIYTGRISAHNTPRSQYAEIYKRAYIADAEVEDDVTGGACRLTQLPMSRLIEEEGDEGEEEEKLVAQYKARCAEDDIYTPRAVADTVLDVIDVYVMSRCGISLAEHCFIDEATAARRPHIVFDARHPILHQQSDGSWSPVLCGRPVAYDEGHGICAAVATWAWLLMGVSGGRVFVESGGGDVSGQLVALGLVPEQRTAERAVDDSVAFTDFANQYF